MPSGYNQTKIVFIKLRICQTGRDITKFDLAQTACTVIIWTCVALGIICETSPKNFAQLFMHLHCVQLSGVMSTWCSRNMLKLDQRISHSLHYVKKWDLSCHNRHMSTFWTHSYFVFKRIHANIIAMHLFKLWLSARYRLYVHQRDPFLDGNTKK